MTAYDIRAKIHLLKKSKGGKFFCPVCGGANLNIQHSSGAYKCYSSECSEKVIREAIDILEGKEPFKPKSDWQKPARPPQRTEYFYPSRDGGDLARVTRVDEGDGGKKFIQGHKSGQVWVTGMPETIRPHLPIYNYDRVRKAISEGQAVWVVEGESCVDALAGLGIVATTSIGGSGGFSKYGDYSTDLEGATLILCPDRDRKGLEYIANWERLGSVAGYYLAGTESLWSNPSGGMDIADDITDHGYTLEQLVDRIISPERFKEITKSGGQLQAIPPKITQDFDEDSLITPLEDEDFLEDQRELEDRLTISSEVLYPTKLAGIIDRDANRLNIDPQSIAAYLLPCVASLMGWAELRMGDNFIVPNILWTVLVQRSGSGKSLAKKYLTRTLFDWQSESVNKYSQELQAYRKEQDSLKYESKGRGILPSLSQPSPTPRLRQYVFDDVQVPTLKKELCYQVETGAVYVRDEIMGIFGSLNSFSSSNDFKESLLETFDGGGLSIIRADHNSSASCKRTRLSIAGGTQPRFLQNLFDSTDAQGLFARFLPFCPASRPISIHGGHLELPAELASLYDSVRSGYWDGLTLDNGALEIFLSEVDETNRLIAAVRDKDSAEANWLAKRLTHMGRLAMVFHAIDCHYGAAKGRVISADTFSKASAQIAQCYSNVRSLRRDLIPDEMANVGELMRRVLSVALRYPEQGVTARDICRKVKALNMQAKRDAVRPADLARDCFKHLEKHGKGTYNGRIFIAKMS